MQVHQDMNRAMIFLIIQGSLFDSGTLMVDRLQGVCVCGNAWSRESVWMFRGMQWMSGYQVFATPKALQL